MLVIAMIIIMMTVTVVTVMPVTMMNRYLHPCIYVDLLRHCTSKSEYGNYKYYQDF